jgi:hypothetical protein
MIECAQRYENVPRIPGRHCDEIVQTKVCFGARVLLRSALAIEVEQQRGASNPDDAQEPRQLARNG